MKVKSEVEFRPVHLVFESQEELELFLETVEDVYLNYEPNSPKRNMLIQISNMFGEYREDYDDFPKVL